ncbi:M20 family metallopeptidase [Tissierella sp. Yu-01]|uniref:M20 metallopeptidase family protein n=1 Tax=Tissierella sp. Yu-01 TaxID=3035694 RepID=UPI00240D61F7|nr:M20 family metallopeptidase [Tissierella sp. Yu-01]WFA08867.1 M20 family metallopeptidase [Tissierella sp. Yu-01]
MNKILQEAKLIQDEIVNNRRYLHQNAEIGQNLPITTKYIIEKLTEMGYDPKVITDSAIVALARGKKEGKTFLLRADIDALPIVEENDLEYKSTTKNMHACGHDTHAAMLLGAAKLLKQHEDEIEGTVKLMFQPAEEQLSGAKSMIEAGVLENPKVDAAAMIHIFSGMPVPAGTLLMPEGGYVSASGDMFHIEVQGKGGHGAMPQDSVDPLNVISHIHLALQEIISREIPPSNAAVITVGQMHGGNAANILPDTAFMEGTIRAFDKDDRALMKKRVVEISEGIATTFRAKATVDYRMECPSVYNDPALYEQVLKINKDLLGEENIKGFDVVYPGGKMTGSEDFGYVSEKVPGLMMVLSGGSPEEGFPYPQHHPKVNFCEDVFYIGSAVYANTAIEWLKNNK